MSLTAPIAHAEQGSARSPLQLSGYVQLDGTLHSDASADQLDSSTGAALNETAFLVRRARLRAAAEHRALHASLELHGDTVDGATARLLAAEVGYRVRLRELELTAALGLFKIPFGREVPERVPERWFLEQTHAGRALFPGNYDAGARLDARWRQFIATLALTNGAPSGERGFGGKDPAAGRDLVGRLGVEATLGGMRFSAGASALAGEGFHPGTPGTKDVIGWIDVNEDGLIQISELQVIEGVPPTPSEPFEHFGLGLDVSLRYALRALGPGEIYGEIIAANNLDRGMFPADPISAGRDFRELAWYAAIVQQVTPHAVIGLRYDHYQPDADAREPQGADFVPIDARFAALSALAAWRYDDRGRLILQLDLDDNPLGRSQGGQPETLGATRVTLRAQMTF